MTKTAQTVLMNVSQMAGGPGDINHGKQILFQMHNTAWMQAKTQMEQLNLDKKKFAYLTKPLLKGVIMPPFINEPTDLSVGEFATLMGGVEVFSRAQGQTGHIGVMGDLAEDAWKRVQRIRDDVVKRFTDDSGNVNEQAVTNELTKLYNTKNSDYHMSADIASRYFYALSPMFDASGAVIPWEEVPRDMKTVYATQEFKVLNGLRNGLRNFAFNRTGAFGTQIQTPPPMYSGGAAPQQQAQQGYTPSAEAQELLQ